MRALLTVVSKKKHPTDSETATPAGIALLYPIWCTVNEFGAAILSPVVHRLPIHGSLIEWAPANQGDSK